VGQKNQDEIYRTLFENMDQGFCILEVIFDENNRAIDLHYLETNPTFVTESRMKNPKGKRVTELVPYVEPYWLDLYGNVALTGQPGHQENYAESWDQWFQVDAFRIGEPHQHRVAVLFRDITHRKRTEIEISEREAKQTFLLKLSDTLRPLADPVKVQDEAARVLGEHLGVSRVMYGEVTENGEDLIVERNFVADGVPVLSGRFRMADFGPTLVEALNEGRTIVIPDIVSAEVLSSAEQEAFSALGIGALIGVPLTKGERFIANLIVHSDKPRAWTSNEIGIIAETAERTWAAVERARAEQAQRQSEEKYRSLFNSIDEGFCIIEMLFDENERPIDYRFLEVNAIFEAQSGIQNAVGRRMREFAPEHEQHWFETYGRVAKTGEAVRFENPAEKLQRYFDVYAFRVGRPEEHRVAVLFKDISAQKRAEEALHENESWLTAVLTELPVGVWIADFDGKIIGKNQKADQIWAGDTPMSEIWEKYTEYEMRYPGSGKKRPLEEYPLVRALKTGQPVEPQENLIRRFDGSYSFALVSASPINDREGQLRGAVAVMLDISERKSAELALKKSEERFRSSVESLAEAFVMYSAVREHGKIVDLRYEYVNNEACNFHKLTREEMVGHTILQIIPAVKETGLFDQYVQVIETGQPLKGRRFVPHKEGGRSNAQGVFDYRVSKFGDGMIITANDVTEQVRLEAEHRKNIQEQELQRRLMDYRDQERQAIARELHDGPVQDLSSLLFNIQYVKEVAEDPSLLVELETIAEGIRTSIQNLRDMINLIRPPSLIRFGLAKAINVYVEDYREKHPQIELNTSLQDDQNRLREPVRLGMFRILQEALTNISKHAQAKSVGVCLLCEDHQVVLEIRDDGDGFQLSENLSDYSCEGHFGLIGMKERADAAGGKFQVTSDPGKGTTIRVIIPTDTSRS
jgi:PAS domain S-box-containing protein